MLELLLLARWHGVLWVARVAVWAETMWGIGRKMSRDIVQAWVMIVGVRHYERVWVGDTMRKWWAKWVWLAQALLWVV